MPELAEVETERRTAALALKNQRIVEVEAKADPIIFERNTKTMVESKLRGRKVLSSDRRGKYFWLILDRAPFPVFHLGMSGYLSIVKKGEEIDAKSVKLVLTASNGTRVVLHDPRRFARVRFANDPLQEPPISKLGYDPLIDFPTAKALVGLLAQRRSPIKSVLLDQSVFAGVGNWIADEVLFQARINPHRLASQLSPKEIGSIRTKILSVIKTAVKVKADYERFPKNWLFHHRWGKKKDAVTAQGHRIVHSTIGGRTTAWVEGLQI